MKSTSIFIRLTESLKASLQELADKDRRTLSDYVRTVLEDHVEKQEKD